jgi:hypothetical protein
VFLSFNNVWINWLIFMKLGANIRPTETAIRCRHLILYYQHQQTGRNKTGGRSWRHSLNTEACPSRAEVKNDWTYTSIPLHASWRAQRQFYVFNWRSSKFPTVIDLRHNHRRPTGCVFVCATETWIMRWPRPELGCCATENRSSKITPISLKYFNLSFTQIKKRRI